MSLKKMQNINLITTNKVTNFSKVILDTCLHFSALRWASTEPLKLRSCSLSLEAFIFCPSCTNTG